MSRYKITIEYDGTAYNGWQRQKNELTVQGAIENAIKSFCQQDVVVFCSGRTDSGVHAIGQVAHFDLEGDFDPYKVMMGLNNYLREQCLEGIEDLKKSLSFRSPLVGEPKNTSNKVAKCDWVGGACQKLEVRKSESRDNQVIPPTESTSGYALVSSAPPQGGSEMTNSIQRLSHLPTQDIIILNCELVDEKFHARFSAKKRFYQYRILNRKRLSPLRNNRVWHVYDDLDLKKMQEASQFLIGKHDFSSFRDSACQAKSPIKTVDDVKLYKGEQDEIIFEISSKSFLHHMVRNIIGTLKMVGEGKVSINEFKGILEAKDRTKAGMTAPACGLYFMKVEY